MAVMSLARTQTALGAFYRRLAVRIGKPKAITATARKLAILVYRTLKGGFHYTDPGAAPYDARQRRLALGSLRRRAASLGFNLVNGQTGEILDGVSQERSVERPRPRVTLPSLPGTPHRPPPTDRPEPG
jgi:hypothetical protein